VISLAELRAARGGGDPGAQEPSPDRDAAARWSLAALRGRLVELSARGAPATLTTAIGLTLEAQAADEPVAWILAPTRGTFYPPDVSEAGVDLAALLVVRVAEALGAARAAERLLRSGAFGLVVLDLGPEDLALAPQGRLGALAQAHDTAVVCLTEKPEDAPSLGSVISLRAEAVRRSPLGSSPQGAGGADAHPDDRRRLARATEPVVGGGGARRASLAITLRVLKDKRRGPGWSSTTQVRGPVGL
jgi:recombination protein RecA